MDTHARRRPTVYKQTHFFLKHDCSFTWSLDDAVDSPCSSLGGTRLLVAGGYYVDDEQEYLPVLSGRLHIIIPSLKV